MNERLDSSRLGNVDKQYESATLGIVGQFVVPVETIVSSPVDMSPDRMNVEGHDWRVRAHHGAAGVLPQIQLEDIIVVCHQQCLPLCC